MKPDGYDVVVFLGAGLVGLGLWWIYPPAALVVVGASLVGTGLFLASRSDNKQGKKG